MICPICTHEVMVFEEHHIIPREYGGEDGPTVNICGSCHNGLHAQARNILSNGKFKEYFSPMAWPRAKIYVDLIVNAAVAWEARNTPNERKLLTIKLDALTLGKLHRLKMDRGFSSLNDLMVALIRQVTQHL